MSYVIVNRTVSSLSTISERKTLGGKNEQKK